WSGVRTSAFLSVGALALCLAIAAYQKRREGDSPRGKPLAFVLFLLLESPEVVYIRVFAGIALAAVRLCQSETDNWLLAGFVVTGAVAGVVAGMVRHLNRRDVRIVVSLLLAAVAVAIALLYLGQLGDLGERLGVARTLSDPAIFGADLLLGIPFFYLLAFSGREEESEAEIGALCAALALGIGMVAGERRGFQSAGFIVAVMVYVWYST